MKKLLKIFFIFCIILLNLCRINFAESNNIKDVEINIYINKNGQAEVTELWTTNIYSGTELYHNFENISFNDIINFRVSEDGIKYKKIDYWDIANNLDEKKYKCGITENEDGVELCWGCGDYGFHTYKLTYIIDNFLQNNNEFDFNVFNFKSPPPEKISVLVKGEFSENAYAKLKNCIGDVEIKNGECKFIITEFGYNDNIKIYMNYEGFDNSIQKEKIIKIKSQNNSSIIRGLKIIIISILIMIIILIYIIIQINIRKKNRIEFRPF